MSGSDQESNQESKPELKQEEKEESKQGSWIDIDPRVMGGAPCLRDTRVTVRNLAMLIDSEYEIPSLLEAFPYLTEVDLFYANTYWLETLSKAGTIPQSEEANPANDATTSGGA
jgi:uncharacterized protein (DUF433 family)